MEIFEYLDPLQVLDPLTNLNPLQVLGKRDGRCNILDPLQCWTSCGPGHTRKMNVLRICLCFLIYFGDV